MFHHYICDIIDAGSTACAADNNHREIRMKLFNWTKIIAVSDSNKKEQIQELFLKHNIKYKMKVKEILQKNAFDTAKIGTLGNNKIKLIYSFYVEKQNIEMGRQLISSVSLSNL